MKHMRERHWGQIATKGTDRSRASVRGRDDEKERAGGSLAGFGGVGKSWELSALSKQAQNFLNR